MKTQNLKLMRQGDVLIEPVEVRRLHSFEAEGTPRLSAGSLILLHGEKTGHAHRIVGTDAVMMRVPALARDIPESLYIGHVRLRQSGSLTHPEHASIELPAGTYRVRRQRSLAADDIEEIVRD